MDEAIWMISEAAGADATTDASTPHQDKPHSDIE